MTNREEQLTRDVMRRVRAIHAMRLFFSPQMIKGLVFLASVGSVSVFVSIPNVIDNMSRLPSAMAYLPYIFSAYLGTSFVVQAVVVLALAALGWLIRDIIRAWSMQRNFVHS